jgi:hypothetical protein
MDILIAIAHIGGTAIALVTFGVAENVLMTRADAQRNSRELEQYMIANGVSMAELRRRQFSTQVIQLLSARYSSELLRNRLSDLCGVLRTTWEWIRVLTIGLAFLVVVWYTITQSLTFARFAWFTVALAVFFWVSHGAVTLVCKLATGRYPGEARSARAAVEESIRMRDTSSDIVSSGSGLP